METFICSAKRSAIGSFQGSLSSLQTPQIAAPVIQDALNHSKLDPHLIEEVYMGCVLSSGLGQAPARQASIYAGLSKGTPCTTVSKVCGSGLKAVMLADSAIRAGEISIAVAGGMENMSQTPYLLPKIRTGLRLGNGELVDSMIKDGLWDVYNDYHMGSAAELCAREHKISREAQDEYAVESYKRAQAAIAENKFKNEITPITIANRKGDLVVDTDEEVAKVNFDKFSSLRPVFEKDGTITAANASSLSDGASAMIVASEKAVKENNLKPMAKIIAQAQAAQDPEWFTTAPALSMKKLLDKTNMKSSDIDLWEINEAFSAVAIVNMQMLELDSKKVNINGGAVSLGHPIGASGARILTTLCHALETNKKKLGIASLCLGGGEAVSLLIENVNL